MIVGLEICGGERGRKIGPVEPAGLDVDKENKARDRRQVIRKPEQREMAMSLYQIQATDEVVNEPCNVRVSATVSNTSNGWGSKWRESGGKRRDDKGHTSLSNWDGDVTVSNTSNGWGSRWRECRGSKWRESHGKMTSDTRA